MTLTNGIAAYRTSGYLRTNRCVGTDWRFWPGWSNRGKLPYSYITDMIVADEIAAYWASGSLWTNWSHRTNWPNRRESLPMWQAPCVSTNRTESRLVHKVFLEVRNLSRRPRTRLTINYSCWLIGRSWRHRRQVPSRLRHISVQFLTCFYSYRHQRTPWRERRCGRDWGDYYHIWNS